MNFLTQLLYKFAPISLDIQAGLESAKNEVTTQAKFLINRIAIPIIEIVLGGLLLFSIAGAVKKHNNSEPYKGNITAIIVIIIAMVLVGSATTWLWQMVG